MEDSTTLRPLPRAALLALALLSSACAGPMKSTAVLQDRGPDGGTVRIVCPGYPPDADAQAQAAAEMAKVCGPRQWKVVAVVLKDVQAPPSPPCGVTGPCYSGTGPRHQQVNLSFRCVDEQSTAIPPGAGAERDLAGSDGLAMRTVHAIQVAAAEATRQGVTLDDCSVHATETPGFVDVWFTNPKPDPQVRGCPPGPCRCFEVRMDQATLRVIGSSFSR